MAFLIVLQYVYVHLKNFEIGKNRLQGICIYQLFQFFDPLV